MKEWITGRNPVYECLQANRRHFFHLLVASGAKKQGRLAEILEFAKKRNIPTDWVDRQELNRVERNPQGVALEASSYPYVSFDQMQSNLGQENEPIFLLLLDQVQDPQNFGALIRSAAQFGVQGILIPPRRSAGITPAVVSTSSGASEHMLIAQSNLAQSIAVLKQRDVWVVGLDMDTTSVPLNQVNWRGNMALVIGSEGSGLRRLVRENCDLIAHIPMRGKLDSLNAAVAGSIALYAAFQERNSQTAAGK